jgi:hypothetical protein
MDAGHVEGLSLFLGIPKYPDPMRIYLLCIALFLFPSMRAQHYHFMYIQSDQQQPFYVKLGNEPLSSSAEGFLILPRLKDSAYEMVIGFPAKKFPEYRFRFAGFKKDRGMALKNFGEKGWGLFDYQTTEILIGEVIPEKREAQSAKPVPLTSDAFTLVLASVIDDPGLLATPLVYMPAADPASLVAAKSKTAESAPPTLAKAKPVENTPTTIVQSKPIALPAADALLTPLTAAKKEDSVAAPVMLAKSDPAVTKIPPAEAATGKPAEAPRIVQLLKRQSTEGMFISYVDRQGGGTADTISVLIPLSANENDSIMATERTAEPSGDIPNLLRTDSVAQATNTNTPGISGDTLVQSVQPVSVGIPLATNVNPPAAEDVASVRPNRANCVRMAAEKDLGAVRKKMVGIRDEDEMVAVALKDFKARCYTTEQVKAICFVFTRDEGRYKLIDAAYPYVYDPARFGDLESLLSDKYFIHRFKALIRE